MTSQEKQAQIADLYFDLERISIRLQEMRSAAVNSLQVLTRIYHEEDQAAERGEVVPVRAPLDISTRSAFSATMSLVLSQIEQLNHSLHWSQRACAVICPELGQIHTLQ